MARSKADKAAAKALDTAREAVAEAKRLAKKADKASKKRAAKVETKFEAVAADLRRAAKADKAKPAKAKPVKAKPVTANPSPKTPEKTAAKPAAPDLDSQTVVQLRQLAQQRGVPGYSRFTKAQLVVSLRS